MRYIRLMAAATAACFTMPAGAATIVQYDSEGVSAGFTGFDSRLGTLNRVNLDVAVRKSRAWLITTPTGNDLVGSAAWTVAGLWRLGAAPGATQPLNLAITGAGTSAAAWQGSAMGLSYGYLDAGPITGSGSYALQPSSFIDTRTVFNGVDTGYFDSRGADTTIDLAAGYSASQLPGACGLLGGQPFASGDDACGSVRYTLTFDYTPSATAAVPEPATWAMMLVGFGAVGLSLRRRGKIRVRATLA